jgi:hypothetical protein
MNENEISFEYAMKHHPKEVKKLQEEAAKKLKKSKAKNKGTDISELLWYYDTWYEAASSTLADLFSKKASKPMSFEEEFQDSCKKTGVDLCCTMKGAYAKEKLSVLPEKIVNNIKEDLQKSWAEKERFDSLTPEQQQKEEEDILKELSKYSGFRAFTF